MADDRIDIEIADKVDPNIDDKIAAIGTAAKASSSSVAELRGELAKIKSNSISELSRSLRDNANATIQKAKADSMAAAASDKTAAAYLRSEKALNQAVAAETKARTEAQRLATETARTASEMAKAEAATLKLAAAQEREAASAAKATAAAETEAAAQARISAMVDRSLAEQAARNAPAAGGGSLGARSGSKSLYEAQTAIMAGAGGAAAGAKEAAKAVEELETVSVGRFARFKAAGLSAYDTVRDAGYMYAQKFKGFFGQGGAKKIVEEGEAVAKLGGHAKVNSTALRELFVIAREGGRGDFTRMAGSVSILASALGLMETVLLPVAIVAGTAFAALKLFQVGFAAEKKGELTAYANTLGLTHKEMRKLGDETVGAEGKLHKFDTVTITMGDTFKGFIATVKEGFAGFGPAATSAGNILKTVLGAAFGFVRLVFVGFYGLVMGGFRTIFQALAAFKTGLSDPIQGVKDFWSAVTNTGKNVGDAIREADTTLTNFGKRMRANTLQAAKDRLKEEAKAIIDNRNPKKPKVDHTAENRAAALAKVNRELDSEIRLMGMVGPEREAAAKFDEINNQLLTKKVHLTAEETKAIKDKIATIQAQKYIQQEMDRIYEEFQAPQRTYNASLEAANSLLDKGKISLAEYARAVKMAENALEDATDPLASVNRQLENQLDLTKKYGQAQSRAQFLQGLQETYRQRGESIYQNAQSKAGPNGEIVVSGAKKLRPEVEAAANKNDQLGNAQFVHDKINDLLSDDEGNKRFVQNYRSMLDQINEMRQQGVISEGEAFKARGELAEQYVHARLANEESVLSQLSSLQNSSNKEIAAIGKAAAITQATIDGYAAVQKALASAPPPFNFALAALVGAAAAANVAKIAGFERGGYTGDGGTKDVAGVVHGREFVVNAAATTRHRELLEMMNRGAALSSYRGYEAGGYVTPASAPAGIAPAPVGIPGAAPNVNVDAAHSVRIVNLTDPREVHSAMQSTEGEEVVLNILARRKKAVAQIVGKGK